VISFSQLVGYLKESGDFDEHLPAIEAYRAQYGVA